mgnify:CR=1 FL=1
MMPVPEPLARVADLMSTFRPWWALCGGWAVDAWIGRLTRDHADVDISVFQDDQRAIFEHLADWQLIAHDPEVDDETSEPWNGRRLALPAHIHARPPDARSSLPERLEAPTQAGFGLDIQLDERSGPDWVLSREPEVARSLNLGARPSGWGVPTAGPEVLLFYKSRDLRPQDESDFLALLPLLTEEQCTWLREAISLVHPGHPWLTQLSL